jgi:Zn-finger nucleic acid-binding protein
MNCPACGRPLSPMNAGGVTVDACRGGCGGIWLDHLELQKLDDADEAAGEALLRVERDPGVQVDPEAIRACPRCGHPAMDRHFYSPQARIVVDECSRCEGVWLDAGELADIRSEYSDGAHRQAAMQEFLDKLAAKERRELGVPEEGVAPAAPETASPHTSDLIIRLVRTLAGGR